MVLLNASEAFFHLQTKRDKIKKYLDLETQRIIVRDEALDLVTNQGVDNGILGGVRIAGPEPIPKSPESDEKSEIEF